MVVPVAAVSVVERHPRGAIAVLESGKRIPADTVMYSAGRQGTADRIEIDDVRELDAVPGGAGGENDGILEVEPGDVDGEAFTVRHARSLR